MKFQNLPQRKKIIPTFFTINAAIIFSCLLSAPVVANEDDHDDEPHAAQKMMHLPLKLAMKSAMAALRHCRKDGYAVSVAVVDRSGVMLVNVRSPMAGPHTIGSSTGKAFTSASMGQPTSRLADLIASNPGLNGLRDMDSRLVILAGGLPIMRNGQRVGGIGVGGAPGGHLDEACAAHGLEKIGAN